jgi:hypothetical protein
VRCVPTCPKEKKEATVMMGNGMREGEMREMRRKELVNVVVRDATKDEPSRSPSERLSVRN